MQCSRPFLFQMCLSLLASMGSCTCKPLDNEVQSEVSDKDDGRLYDSQLLLEQELQEEELDSSSRLESLLGTMKEGFLRKLNLSDVPQESAKIHPPQFMMELYNKYASNSTAIPQSDVIRSFTVQGTCSKAALGDPFECWFSISELVVNLFHSMTRANQGMRETERQYFVCPGSEGRITR